MMYDRAVVEGMTNRSRCAVTCWWQINITVVYCAK